MALNRLTQITSSGISSTSTITVSAVAGSITGVVTATSLTVTGDVTSGMNVSGIVTATTVQVGSATTIHTTGIDLGSGNITSHNINSTGIITSTSFVGPVTGNVTGNLTGDVTGNVSSSGANTLGSLSVTNDATVGGALTVTGDLTVNGTTTTIDTAVTAVDSLAIDGDASVGGSVGIGTDNPQRKLSIKDSGNTFISIENSTNVTSGLIGANSSGLTLISRDTQGGSTQKPIQFITGSTEKVRITSGGLVGINSEGTSAYLTIRDSEDGGNGNNGSGVLRFSRRNGGANDAIIYAVHDGSDGVSALRFDLGSSERARITSSGTIQIGNPTERTNIGSNYSSRLQVEGTDFDTARISIISNSTNNSLAPQLVLGKTSTADINSIGAVVDTEAFGAINFMGSDGTFFREGAFIEGRVDGTVSSGVVPGSLRFYTTNSSGNRTEKLRITSGGNIGIGTDVPSAKLHVNSNTTTQVMISNISSSMNDGDTIGVLDFAAGPNHTVNARIAGHIEGTDELGGDLVFETREDGGSLLEKLRITSGGNIGINTNDPTSKITINVDSNNQTMASYDGINISNSDTTVNNGSAVIFGFGPSSPNSFSRIGVQNKDRGSGTESQDLFFGTISNGSYAERLRIGTNGRLCLHNVTDGANSSYGKFEIQHVGANGIDPNTSYLSFHRTANTAFQMGIVDNKFVLGVTGGAARDDVQTPHVVFDPTGTDTILGLGTTIPNGKGLDITHSRTNSYSQTSDQRNLAHLILRNGSDAPDRFTSLSMVSGGGTQAEGSINLVQNGNYRGHFAFKLRHSGGSTDWMERFRIGTDGELMQYSYGAYIRYYTTTTNASTFRTHVAIPMNGNVAYEIRFTGCTNGIDHIRCMASHWTGGYDLIRESYLAMDAYDNITIRDQINQTSTTQGSWSFSRPASNQTGYQSHLVINKSAGSYGGSMTAVIVLESHKPYALYSIT